MTCPYSITHPWLLSTWVKAPILRGNRLIIVSACLPYINRELFKKLSNEGTVILACPEREPAMHYGKIASITHQAPKPLGQIDRRMVWRWTQHPLGTPWRSKEEPTKTTETKTGKLKTPKS
ncbi:MAG: hypothetical protein ACP5GZ_01540 [Vulcanisaeta sp.]|uniref:hypothetical protein n=1 Tax=Vulcanisaeta sp. TaxID=2020871 RepID=UPI003D116D2B